jgi:TolB-like protein/Flp pilus assembly protein TadD/tRNA A-37 threonylcarbamoyl transferase component Bud32
MDLKADQLISHYRLIEQIGAGGMGIVWKALDTKLNRPVAIKILPPELTADEERRLRFQREAQTAAALSHPNVAVIHEVGEHEGIPFLVMELLTGKTLREVVRNRRLPLKEWLDYALPIANGLAHAHKSGIVHRDLKSSNVMITEEQHVKLLDFGLAKLLEPESVPEPADADVHSRLDTISRELTRAGKVLGTVAYMSPEQARGQPVDHRSDIFSFGVLLYEMATGSLPFQGDSDVESLNATLTREPRRLSEIVEDVPAEVARIVAKAMEKEPGRRYQHADDIVTDFRNLKRDLDTGRVSIAGSGTDVTAKVQLPSAGTRVKPWMMGAAAALVLIAAVWGVLQFRGGSGTNRTPTTGTSEERIAAPAATTPTRIAVLPFENLGPAEDEYFAAGITEEIIGRLASVRDLSVISRTSVFQYDKSGKTLQEIGRDFGVDHILEGSVRWARGEAGSRVRISPQLVRVADDTSIWGDTYDSPMDDIFRVQSEIAGQVIEALGLVLLAPERESIELRPTENQDAYRAYLRGTDALITDPTSELAEQMYRRAVDLDPSFALAWAGLSRAHSWRYHGGDMTEERCTAAKEAADEALRLTPEAPEARMALGLYHYRCFRDYEKALAEIETAGKDRPHDTDVISWKATLHKRQGNFHEAVRLNRRTLELDPMDFTSADELGLIHFFLREYRTSEQAFDRAIAISPDVPGAYTGKASIYYSWKGSVAEARATLDAMPATDSPLAAIAWFLQEYYAGRYQDALVRIERFPELLEGQEALNARSALAALCYEGLGETERARASWEAAVKQLQNKAHNHPEDFRAHTDLGLALAALGRKEQAVQAAKRAVELMPFSKDAEAAATPAANLALTYATLGDHDAAFDLVEQLLEKPGWLSIPRMRLDPRWKPLVEHPRFAALAQRFDTSAN